MAHKKGLEALDRTLRDFRRNQLIMGGALILLAGDFRQTLPVIPKSTPADKLNACLKNSTLWRHVEKITLSSVDEYACAFTWRCLSTNICKTTVGYG